LTCCFIQLRGYLEAGVTPIEHLGRKALDATCTSTRKDGESRKEGVDDEPGGESNDNTDDGVEEDFLGLGYTAWVNGVDHVEEAGPGYGEWGNKENTYGDGEGEDVVDELGESGPAGGADLWVHALRARGNDGAEEGDAGGVGREGEEEGRGRCGRDDKSGEAHGYILQQHMRFKVPLIALALVIIAISAVLIWRSIMRTPTQTPAQTPTLPSSEKASINGVPAQNKMQGPDAFVVSFYSWYIEKFSAIPPPAQYAALVTSLTQWLTPDFAAQYAHIAAETDVNPITFAEDFYVSWFSHTSTVILSQSPTAAEVRISLGAGKELTELQVSLTRIEGAWRVAKVARAH